MKTTATTRWNPFRPFSRFLKCLFTKLQPPFHDADLGELTHDRYRHWNCSIQFSPTNSNVDISFRTGDIPPSALQIAFFRDVESRFSEVWAALRDSLFEDVEDLPDGTTMAQFFDSLMVNSITFWNVVDEPFEWQVSCFSELDDHLFTIHMFGFEDQGFTLDG